MIVVISGRLISKGLLESDLDIEELSSGLSPSMEVLVEHIIELIVWSERWSHLIHVRWDIALLDNICRPDLSNMHIYQQAIVSIYFEKFVFSKLSCINVMLDIAVLVW